MHIRRLKTIQTATNEEGNNGGQGNGVMQLSCVSTAKHLDHSIILIYDHCKYYCISIHQIC